VTASVVSPAPGAPGTPADAGAPLPARRPRRRAAVGRVSAYAGLLPFAAYTALFLGLPTVMVGVDAFRAGNGNWTWENIRLSTRGVYRDAFVTSIEISLLSAAIGVVFGAMFAQAVLTTKRNNILRRVVTTASGVFANFGGVPLAFAFIATVGTTGMVTRILHSAGFNLSSTGFDLYSFSGITVVYTYFEVPLMVLVFTPALEGLRTQWREASDSLGGSGLAYWRHIGLPVLAPSLIGSFLLLFGGGFSAYATAQALTSGTVSLVPIKIGALLSGNVLANGENLGKALGFEMIVIVLVVMVGYTLLQRRASRWLR